MQAEQDAAEVTPRTKPSVTNTARPSMHSRRPMSGLSAMRRHLGGRSEFIGIRLRDRNAEGGGGNEDDPDEEVFHGNAPYV